MAYQRVPETAEVVIELSLAGQVMYMTFHARYTGGYSQADLDALALNVDFTPAAGLMADLSGYCSYVKTIVRGLDAENDISAENNSSAGGGGVGTTSLPGNVSFCVSKLSGLTGRNARGRVFIPGIPASALMSGGGNDGLITVAYADAYRQHIDDFRTTLDFPPSARAVIVSRHHNGAKRAEAVTFDWTSTAYTDRVLDQMRSRKRSS